MKKKIVLDPGHGGKDPGASANGLIEKNLNLDICRKLVEKLSLYDAEVFLTRDSDISLDLKARADIANQIPADFFLSIHCNAGGGEGFESYVHPNTPPAGLAARETLHREVARFMQAQGLADRGMKTADFAVLRLTKMPAVLLELLFVDHPRDAELLKKSAFLNDLAAAIALGMAGALGLEFKQDNDPVWDPQMEIDKLKKAGLIISDHSPGDPVTWGEFATVLNKLIKNN